MNTIIKPSMRKFLRALYDEAFEKNMDVDPETMSLVPIQGYPKEWPTGDRTPEDYEGGEDR